MVMQLTGKTDQDMEYVVINIMVRVKRKLDTGMSFSVAVVYVPPVRFRRKLLKPMFRTL